MFHFCDDDRDSVGGNKIVVSLKPIRLYRMDRYALSAKQKSKNQKKDTNYFSALGNQQNWFAKYINKKAYSTFSQPLNRQNLWRRLFKNNDSCQTTELDVMDI